MKSKLGWLLGLVAGFVVLVLLTPSNQQQVFAQSVKTNGVFGGLLLGGTTNIISDNGTTLTRNGSAITGGGGGFAGAVSNSVASAGLLAVDATKTNGIAATFAHVTNALGYLPATNSALGNYVLKAGDTMSGTLVAPAAQVSDLLIGAMAVNRGTLTHAGTVTLDCSLTNRYASLSLTGNVTFATANLAAGKWYNVILTMTSTNDTPTFPAWKWLGGAPSTLTGGQIGVLSIYPTSTTDATTLAAYTETQ